ncbi:MAG: ABC transporter ATP-binding protein [Gaiellaceae bacterium]
MNSETTAIVAEGLGKQYRIGSRPTAYRTLRESLAGALRQAGPSGPPETFWALKDVSFEVGRGEAIGVIGPNGAGKTTLLKVLSRITEPTAGVARVRGRVGSLLEVGTGFHPELTGRENIYLNGSILGMARAEIARKFDEIVAFAGVEQFIDTPVKRYSSGMYVRLAFAVAAHLDTDILLVDEVLSVGDFAFQRRSLGKMQQQTSAEGRTVLFVSHNLGSVRTLTERCIWLEHGQIRELGPTEDVFRSYVRSYGTEGGSGSIDLSDLARGRPATPLAQEITFETLELLDRSGTATATHPEGEPVTVRLRLRARSALRDVRLQVYCRVATADGAVLFSATAGPQPVQLEPGVYETAFTIDPNPLGAGGYTIWLYALTLSDRTADVGQDLLRSAATLSIEDSRAGERDLGYAWKERGLIRVGYEWAPLSRVEGGVPVSG